MSLTLPPTLTLPKTMTPRPSRRARLSAKRPCRTSSACIRTAARSWPWSPGLVGHKGVDLVQAIAEGLLQQGIELVILGSGEAQYENFFNELCARNPGRVGVYIGFNAKLAQQIYAGADIFLMPSRSEPCGLAQMVSCRYGTIPVVRETGGLKDSIRDSGDGYGNGFTFANYNAHELYEACWRAKEGYWQKDGWPVLVKRAMECDFSWSNSAKSYEGLYNEVVNLW